MNQLKPMNSYKQYFISLFICIFLLSQSHPVEYLDSETTKMYDHLEEMPDDFYMFIRDGIQDFEQEECCSLIYENSTKPWAYIEPDETIFAVTSNQEYVLLHVQFSHHSSNESYNEIDVSFTTNSTSVVISTPEYTLASEDVLSTIIEIHHPFIRNSNDEVVDGNNTYWFSGSAVSDSGNLLKQKDFEITICYGVMTETRAGNDTINPYFAIDNPDGDLLPSMCDADDDNDGWNDENENNCGTDSLNSNSIPIDADDDLICNFIDEDDDNDSWNDENENNCDTDPLNSSSIPTDTDDDLICNFIDEDDDNDGWNDENENNCGTDSLNSNSIPTDTDDDLICNFIDEDDDNDSWNDENENNCDTDSLNSSSIPTDTDGDLICNFIDEDDDNDGYSDLDETTNCGLSSNPVDEFSTPEDFDSDFICNLLDKDDDNDGVNDQVDDFPLDETRINSENSDASFIIILTLFGTIIILIIALLVIVKKNSGTK